MKNHYCKEPKLVDGKQLEQENKLLHSDIVQKSSNSVELSPINNEANQRILGPIKEALFLSEDFNSTLKNNDMQYDEGNIIASGKYA